MPVGWTPDQPRTTRKHGALRSIRGTELKSGEM